MHHNTITELGNIDSIDFLAGQHNYITINIDETEKNGMDEWMNGLRYFING